MYLIELVNSLSLTLDYLCGESHRGAFLGYLLKDYRVCGDLGVVAYPERTKHLCARAHHNTVAECGVTFAYVLSRTAERDALIDSAVVAYLCGFTYDDTHTVVDNESATYLSRGVYLNTRTVARELTYSSCAEIMLLFVKFVCYTVGKEGVDARIEQ